MRQTAITTVLSILESKSALLFLMSVSIFIRYCNTVLHISTLHYLNISAIAAELRIDGRNVSVFTALQRMDLGECPKIHDYALRADYNNAKASKDYYYDIDVRRVIRQLDFTIC